MAIQLSANRTIGGRLAPNQAVIFNNVLSNGSGVTYNAATGLITFNTTNPATITWAVNTTMVGAKNRPTFVLVDETGSPSAYVSYQNNNGSDGSATIMPPNTGYGVYLINALTFNVTYGRMGTIVATINVVDNEVVPPEPTTPVTDTHMSAKNIGGAVTPTTAGVAIALADSQVLSGFSVNTNNTEFTVSEAGTYLALYNVNLTEGAIVGTQLTLNGIVITETQIAPTADTTTFNYSGIITLAANDIVSLQLYNSTTEVTLTTGYGASLTLVRLN